MKGIGGLNPLQNSSCGYDKMRSMHELKHEPRPLQYQPPVTRSESRLVQFIVELLGLILFMGFLGAAVLAWQWLR